MTNVERIDFCLRLNWLLIADGPHPAVDGKAVRRAIDRLLDERARIIARPQVEQQRRSDAEVSR